MRSVYNGNIGDIRAVEDAIRATKQYTEGVITMFKRHPTPVQGGEFPSKAFTKHYEVYPGVDIDWNMPVNTAIDWLWCDTPCVGVVFYYDYRRNRASCTIKDGPGIVKALTDNIPGLNEALAKVLDSCGNGVAASSERTAPVRI